jgi:hypothetical protein
MNLTRKLSALLLTFFTTAAVFADTVSGITGSIEWDTLRIKAVVSLNLAQAGIKLPSGRSQGEVMIDSAYLKLIRPGIMNIQVDSSSTIADLVERGEFSLPETESLARQAQSVPPAISPDFKNLSASYTLGLSGVSAALYRHERPTQIMRTLNPVPSPDFTGIVIIASENLPVYGMKSSALPVPCLFPKIWDTGMNLIFERNMVEVKNAAMVRYSPESSIFQDTPSGISEELTAVIGERPLRIFARGVFGSKPTDLIIDNDDALLIISSSENRRLLTEGRVVIILNNSVLKREFSGE